MLLKRPDLKNVYDHLMLSNAILTTLGRNSFTLSSAIEMGIYIKRLTECCTVNALRHPFAVNPTGATGIGDH
jgi:hypothetical protein